MRTIIPSFLIAVVVVVACMSGHRVALAQRPSLQAWDGELPFAEPWLRAQPPPGMLAYQRIPYPLALMAMPKGNMLDTALASDANISSLLSIQQGLADNLAAELSLPLATLLLHHLRSPIEIAVTGLPAPAGLVGATLDLHSAADLESLIAELSAQLPIALLDPLDADGFGQLTGLPLPTFLHFDADSGRLALYGSQMGTVDTFRQLLEPAGPVAEHPMLALEAEIDSSGQGLFGWIDAAQALQMGALMLPPETMQQLRAFGLDSMRALAFGAGVADGKGRMKVLADLGPAPATRILPIIDNGITARSVGDPRGVFLLSLPGVADFERLEALALNQQPVEVREQWSAIKQQIHAVSNTTMEEILAAIGPELLYISDEAGDYLALHVRDRALLDDVLSRLSNASGIAIEERRVGRQTIRYITAPTRLGLPQTSMAEDPNPFAGMVDRLQTRIYWTEDGDYLYLAGIPQLLIERGRLGADTSIATWLEDTQRFDMRRSLIAGTGSIPRVPALMYQAYLNMMQNLSDLAGVDYDIWAMPTASQLDLPERGTIGFGINLGDPIVSLEMSYESHPGELLFGTGSLASFAAAAALTSLARADQSDDRISADGTSPDDVSADGLSADGADTTTVAGSEPDGGASAPREALP
jgi:hypothetical protein